MEGDSMTQLIDTPALDGKERSQKRLWDVISLPNTENARKWQSILRSTSIKQSLKQYALHTKELADNNIPRSDLDLSGVVLLCGPPGVGKTTLAHGFANEYAKTQAQTTRLFALHTEHLFSEWLGQSAKELAKAFAGLRFSAEDSPCVLLVDEIEAIAFARNKVISSSDPSDLVRFVDQLYKEIDSLQAYPNALVVGTSNFPEVIDSAFWSRADLVLQIGLPDLPTRQAILQARLRTVGPLGLALATDEVLTLAKAAEGMSGRSLGKLYARTYFEQAVSYADMSVEHILETITKTHLKEDSNGDR
jgi:SpoVK/Ycf46/Vps4 family AAA+-type ATPase